jgi:hypothetical protein
MTSLVVTSTPVSYIYSTVCPTSNHHFQFCPADHDDHYQQLYHDYASTLVLLVEHDYYYNDDDPFVVQYQ